MAIIEFPLLYVPDPLKGRPLFNCQIFVGTEDLDPEVVGNQKQLNVIQEDGTIVPVSQPFVTSAGGVPTYNGATVRLDVDGNYSFKVLDSLGVQKYYVQNVVSGTPITGLDLINDLSQTYGFETVAEYKDFSSEFPDGKQVVIAERAGATFTKITGTGTDNIYSIIGSTEVTQSIVLNEEDYSLKALGGIASPTTDNSAVIQFAVSLGRWIPVEAGDYGYTYFHVPRAGGLIGQGFESTQFTCIANGVGQSSVEFLANVTGASRVMAVQIKGIKFQASALAAGSGIDWSNLEQSQLEDCAIVGFGEDGIKLGMDATTFSGSYYNTLSNNRIRENAVGLRLYAGVSGFSGNTNRIVGGQINANTEIGIHVEAGATNVIFDSVSVENDKILLLHEGTGGGICYIGCRFEAPAVSGTHDGSDNASVLTDTTANWAPGLYVDRIIFNFTDGSKGRITANTATTITATLADGTENDWDIGDGYIIQGVVEIKSTAKDVLFTGNVVSGTVAFINESITTTVKGNSGVGFENRNAAEPLRSASTTVVTQTTQKVAGQTAHLEQFLDEDNVIRKYLRQDFAEILLGTAGSTAYGAQVLGEVNLSWTVTSNGDQYLGDGTVAPTKYLQHWDVDRVNFIKNVRFDAGLRAPALPTFANDAAAGTLTTGDFYKTATGELRIKL